MKSTKSIVVALFVLSFFNYQAFSQCTPDTLCIDTESPGQMCPDSLPNGTENLEYNQVITILPPDTIEYQGNTVLISHLKLETINNLPPGLTFESNVAGDLFAVGSSYCVLVSGTPTTAGEYQLSIEVTPYVLGFPAPTTIIDDTSLSITINAEISIELNSINKFEVKPIPNPFTSSVELYFTSPQSGFAQLFIYNKIGKTVYSEQTEVIIGDNKFKFTGNDLSTGMYFYHILFEKESFSGKLEKIKK